ncbi:TfoX/Sxy family protein [Mycolicibacterium elephantis]|uniref:TfoX/Sxy family protein n=1 Tax=Mycolicibacterium elephantis TaxID=81858 RepID=UPI0007E9F857|nr:TfoX/Sxy family protein [Mycolicibacterium elephantis]OBE98295.1 RNA methyltransferase [Mycolicibacterium elephantis]
MAYDAELAARVRELIGEHAPAREQPMFGGLAFLVANRMAVVASNRGGLMVRIDPAESEQFLKTTGAQPMEVKGRTYRGWLHIDGEHVRTRRALKKWVAVGIDAAIARAAVAR